MRQKTGYLVIVVMASVLLMVPLSSAQNGPVIDVLRFKVIKGPALQALAMQTGQVDVLSSKLCEFGTEEIETFDEEGFLVTQDLAYHIGFIGYNIRDAATIRSYYRVNIEYWPLHDVEFRHALIHCYDQLGNIPSSLGYTVAPVDSLVPPAQSKYYNSAVMDHPYNPGDPFTSLPGDESSCGILKAAGYTFEDAGILGFVDAADYWKCPDGSPLPYMELWTPTPQIAPPSYDQGVMFVYDLRQIGLAATAANGNAGFNNEGRELYEYLGDVYGTSTAYGGRFDAYMIFQNLGSLLPDQLYWLCHTSQDSRLYPLRRNAVGMNNPTIDSLVETVKYSLDVNDVEYAAKQVQEMLYDPSLPGADNFTLAYMCMYSKNHFNIYAPGLGGVVKSPGFGSDNKWTFLNIHWETNARTEEGKTVVIWALGDDPDSFNPLYASSANELETLSQTQDGLTAVNPYNHRDIPWIASSWTITETPEGMNIDFIIRNDVKWQDGTPLTAYDIEWCLEFLRDMEIPKYYTAWQFLIDVVVTDNTHCTIQLNAAGLSLFYDVVGVGALLAPQIWDRPWGSSQEVLDWIPTGAYDPAPGYAAGPTPTPTNVMGTGSFIFEFYDSTLPNQYCEMHRNPNYFMSQAAIASLMTSMFWQVGDEDHGGLVDVSDLTQVSFAYGSHPGGARWNPDANFDLNSIIDIRDLRTCSYHQTWQKYQ